MKKIIFSISLLSSIALYAQKTIVVNGGLFGSTTDLANVSIYDIASGTSTIIDTIGTNSTQGILIDGNEAYVAAADSIIKYDLTTETRLAANSFPGVSTARMALASNNELVVSNFFGKSSYNLYIYDQTTLALKDSIDIQRPVTSMAANTLGLLVVQNGVKASGFGDTLGYVLAVSVANRSVLDTIRISNYTGDIGQIIPKPNISQGFYTINSGDNSITDFSNPSIFPPFFTTNVVATNQNLQVSNPNRFAVNGDTAFLAMNNGIGAYNLNNLALLDSQIVNFSLNAFDYDTANNSFYVSQIDFANQSNNVGAIFSRNGQSTGNFPVGFSPEALGLFYDQTTGINDVELASNSTSLSVYPNPAVNQVTVRFDDNRLVETVSIFDMNGRLVSMNNLFNGQATIDMENLESGIYIVSVLSGNTIHTQKLIKQ